MRSTYWTEEEDAILKEMVLAGVYYSAIGEKLGRGKNAVISRSKRLGFAKLAPFKEAWNKNLKIGFGQKASESKPKPKPKIKVAAPELPESVQFYCDPVEPPADAENLSFEQMSRGRCWFPEGEDSANLIFCGARAPAGSSWCVYHRAIVFVPYQPRKHREGHWR